MGYAALTGFISPDGLIEDQRTHAQWVEAMVHVNWRGVDVPDRIKADIVALMDAAVERALKKDDA